MKLIIDGFVYWVRPEQSLLDIIKEFGLITGKLSTDPIAAKIAGEVFTLNYIPMRMQDAAHERESIRKAMAASDGKVSLLRYSDPSGKDAYRRTAQFVLFLAVRKLWPNAVAKMNCTVGSGVYIKVTGAEDFSVERLKECVRELIAEDIPLVRRRIPTPDAIEYFSRQGQEDKARLLAYRAAPTLDVYGYGDFFDYYYGEMAPSTGFLRVWDIIPARNGFIFIFPDRNDPDRVSDYHEMTQFMEVYDEGKRWCELMRCETVADLNVLVDSGKLRELVRVNEALHEKRFGEVADMICARGAKAVMLAGPSSSGKTTSANRLATQLRAHGKMPILMSLDDYYIDRDKIAPGPDGTIDLEHINTIDTELFGEHLARLLNGETVEIPRFDFLIQRRVMDGSHMLRIDENTPLIIEGLHGLNPMLLSDAVDRSRIYRLYVSALTTLNLDDHNRIPTTQIRLLRRIVRDYETRGASVEQTLSMWASVRRGEERWIFPYQEQADAIFNSALVYEPAVLKKHIFPLLNRVRPDSPYYEEVRSIVKFLNYFLEADVEDEIPPTSVLREFIGGNTFYK